MESFKFTSYNRRNAGDLYRKLIGMGELMVSQVDVETGCYRLYIDTLGIEALRGMMRDLSFNHEVINSLVYDYDYDYDDDDDEPATEFDWDDYIQEQGSGGVYISPALLEMDPGLN